MNFSLRRLYQVIGLALLLAVAACGNKAEDASSAPSSEAPIAAEAVSGENEPGSKTMHEAMGTVANILAGRTYIVIDHGPISGYMGAMKGMVFPVSDTSILAGVQPGDSITFTFTEADGIQAVEKTE